MSTFVLHEIKMHLVLCGKCDIRFGMPHDKYRRCTENGEGWTCPNGHSRIFCESTTDKLKRRLEATERRLTQEQQQKLQARSERDAAKRKYGRIRDRVKNGVCPCCNRQFPNLARHMATKHPGFGTEQTLKALRLTYGLTQEELAREVGVSAAVISNYENRRRPQPQADPIIEAWIEAQA